MLRKIAFILSISLFSTAACMKAQIETNAADGNSTAVNSIAENPKSENANGTTNEKTVVQTGNEKIFRGMINGIGFEMKLARAGEKLSGTYFYTKVGKALKLDGTIDKDGKFKLKETDASGKTTGEFEGNWKESAAENGITLEGYWKKPFDKDGGFPFYASEQIIEFTGSVKLTDKIVKETDKSRRSDINQRYPEISGVDAATAAKFNELTKNLVMSAVNAYKKEIGEFTPSDIKSLPPSAGLSNEGGYDVALANNDFVSLIFSNYVYTGGAHGGTSSATVNYDLKNNRKLELADVFEPNSNYLKVLSDYSIADLKTRLKDMSDDEWINRGAAADAENYASWNLTKKGVMITFDQYQVAAYAAGPQTVIVPFEKLKNILRKDGAAANLLK